MIILIITISDKASDCCMHRKHMKRPKTFGSKEGVECEKEDEN